MTRQYTKFKPKTFQDLIDYLKQHEAIHYILTLEGNNVVVKYYDKNIKDDVVVIWK